MRHFPRADRARRPAPNAGLRLEKSNGTVGDRVARYLGADAGAGQAQRALTATLLWHLRVLAHRPSAGDSNPVRGDTVATVLGDDPGVDVRERVSHGTPAQILIDAGKDARLLVVGSRGHGGFTGLLLGSVSAACAEHAHCPVGFGPLGPTGSRPDGDRTPARSLGKWCVVHAPADACAGLM